MDDDSQYQVLINDEEQYSLWPVTHDVPAGWRAVGKEGSKQDCMSYVDEVWTDMRPRSLREQMDAPRQ
ncbi:MbtH family protein [Actinocrispum wychmicini]|uniref:MbtH protein n=1 Tax=Actinocrispum wychmicini TaxID=1213861 RepID=A0A4V2S605_9PSEU|nr:MbtH family NRPS accessory protein [Actinocrispum wychmicini]TCO54190.1 MbtH protein [Actinocrispum wychmicini]